MEPLDLIGLYGIKGGRGSGRKKDSGKKPIPPKYLSILKKFREGKISKEQMNKEVRTIIRADKPKN